MNEKLKNRFDALSSSSDNEQLSWSAMEPAIQEALGEKKKKRRGLLWWWWGGASSVILLTGIFIFFLSNQHQSQTSTLVSSSASEQSNISADFKSKQSPKTESSLSVSEGSTSSAGVFQMSSTDLANNTKLESGETRIEALAEEKDRSTLNPKNLIAASSELFDAKPGKDEGSNDPLNVAGDSKAEGDYQTGEQAFDSGISSFQNDKRKEELSKSGDSALRIREAKSAALISEDEQQNSLLPLPTSVLKRLPLTFDLSDTSRVQIVAWLFPEENVKRGLAEISIIAFGGSQYGAAAQAYEQSQSFLGLTGGLGLEYELPSGWFGGLGVRMDRTVFSTTATLVDTVQEYRPNQISRVYTLSNNRVILEYGDSVSVEYTRRINHNNSQLDLTLPLYLGHRWKSGKWGVGLFAGANLILSQQLGGKLLSSEREIVDVDQRSRKLSVTPHIGADLNYEILDHWSVLMTARGTQSVGVSSAAVSNPSKFWLTQMTVGLRYKL